MCSQSSIFLVGRYLKAGPRVKGRGQYCVNPSSSVLSHVEFACLVLPLSFKLWKILKANHYHTTCLNGNKWTLLPFANFSTISQKLQCIVVFHFVNFDHWSHHRRYLAYLGMFPSCYSLTTWATNCVWFLEPLLLTGAHSMKAAATLPFGQPFRLSLDETRLEVPMSHFCALFPSLVVKVGFGWCVSSFHLFLNLACAKWCQMVPNGAKWCQMVIYL